MSTTNEKRTFLWIMGVMFTILLSLVGVIYANITKEIDKKADKEVVEMMQSNIKDIKNGVDKLVEMHLEYRNGDQVHERH